MAAIKINKEALSETADAARRKTRRSAPLSPREIVDEIGMIPSCGKDERDAEWILRNLKTVIFPDNITAIPSDFFSGCAELMLTDLPDTIIDIGGNAFNGCRKLAISRLPEQIETIGMMAFYGCREIDIKTIPQSLVSMQTDSRSIFESPKITTITFLGVPTLRGNIFSGCSNLTVINVPWAEGEVAGAPWGATKATINYNYKEAQNNE